MTAQNALAIAKDIDLLRTHSRFQSAAILQSLAEEEAAKVLMLLDIVRCDWSEREQLNNFMKSFYSHLARGIYVAIYGTKPAYQSDQRDYANLLRRQRYLDGPIGFEWIFGNDITTTREQIIYVDYVQNPEDQTDWISPQERYRSGAWAVSSGDDKASPVLSLVSAMEKIGIFTEENFEKIRQVYSPLQLTDDSHWQELREINTIFISQLDLEDDLHPSGDYIREKWIFPMSLFDLNQIEIKEQTLKHEQDRLWKREVDLDDY